MKSSNTTADEYKELFNLIGEAVVLVDNRNGRIMEANRAAVELYGYSYEELLTLHNVDVSVEPEKTKAATHLQLTSIPVRFHKRKDGTVFPVEINARHHTWHGVDVHLCVIREISQQLATEVEREHNRQKFRALFDNAGEAIFIHGLDGRILDANLEACRRYGYGKDELVGRQIADLDDTSQHQRIPERLAQVLTAGRATFESVHRSKAGELFAVDVAVRLIAVGDERFVLASCHDITPRRQAEEALRESEEKYRVLVEDSSDPIYSMTPAGHYR